MPVGLTRLGIDLRQRLGPLGDLGRPVRLGHSQQLAVVESVTAAETSQVMPIEELRKTLRRLVQSMEAGTAPKADHGCCGGCGGNKLATVER